ncbi:glycosyl transferase [Aquirufa ecclesiirivi]|uniref:glycosyl transferase n=1 Tax=Aquirufa ecclesiirivi TaxID=2715124 RepID=UPI0023D86BFB|nr:glycosyl transferase [Aquirufa ecclesiirivi]MDF0692742.1 glycosyl transferase [Aquirufa ecclesiirivi]
MQKIVLTICSINYLAQAKSLGDSLLQHNPDYTFLIGLVDRLDQSSIDKSQLPDYPLIELHTIGIEDLDELCDKYNITELNTAVKPFFMEYVYNTYPEAEIVHYFDPDILVFQALSDIESPLKNHSLVLTPHIVSPYPDTSRPQETDLLNTGIFNLGFLGTKRSPNTLAFLHWWKERLRDQCYIDLANGMFVDQLWVNFAPVYFDDVYISRHLGLNMAYWNLHERTLTGENIPYSVNDAVPLIFFHFSGYHPENPTEISKYQNRYTFQEKPDVATIFDQYAQILIKNGHEMYKKFPCFYIKAPIPKPRKRFLRVRKYLSLPFQKVVNFIDKVQI